MPSELRTWSMISLMVAACACATLTRLPACHNQKTRASAIEILKPVNLKKALRTLEFTDGVVTTVSDEAIMDAMAMVSKNGFGCEPASAATVAGTKKLVDQGIIRADATVVGIATGHILKDTAAIVDYHFNPKNQFANTPITVEPDVSKILRLANS